MSQPDMIPVFPTGSFRERYRTPEGKDPIPKFVRDGEVTKVNSDWVNAPFEEIFLPHDLYTRTP